LQEEDVGVNDQRLRSGTETVEGGVDFAFGAGEHEFRSYAERPAARLRARNQKPRRVRSIHNVDEDCEILGAWQQLVQQPDPFRAELEIHRGDAGDIAAGMIKGGDKSGSHRIDAYREHNGDLRCRRPGGARAHRGAERNDDRYTALYQIDRQRRQLVGVVTRPAKLTCEVLTLSQSGFGEALARCGENVGACLGHA